MQSFNCTCLLLFLLHLANAIESKSDVYLIAKLLRPQIQGYVFLRGSPDYETARPVHNGLCRNIYPLMIVKPLNSEDVANAVKMAVKFNLEISVRGGGHSYQCLGIKVTKMYTYLNFCAKVVFLQDNSMNIDLRRLNEIEFYPSSSMVRFGSGVTWNDVLKVVNPEKYTVIHGNVRINSFSKLGIKTDLKIGQKCWCWWVPFGCWCQPHRNHSSARIRSG